MEMMKEMINKQANSTFEMYHTCLKSYFNLYIYLLHINFKTE